MKWILFIFMSGSSGSGPTVPISMTAEFDDRVACERAVPEIERISRQQRVLGSRVDWSCVPKAWDLPKPPQ